MSHICSRFFNHNLTSNPVLDDEGEQVSKEQKSAEDLLFKQTMAEQDRRRKEGYDITQEPTEK